MSISDPVPKREDDTETKSVIRSDLIPEYHSDTDKGTRMTVQVQETGSPGSINIVQPQDSGYFPDGEPELGSYLTPASEIHDRTTELESRVSVLEDEVESRVSILEEKIAHNSNEFNEVDPNPSFQNAVKQSLIEGDILQDPDIQSQLDSSPSAKWDNIPPEVQGQIRTASLEPVHDLAVLFGAVVSGLGTVGSLLVGFHLLGIIFLVMTGFLIYSYRTGLGE